jgi:hypothetical protein
MIWSLVEISLISFMVFVKDLANEFEDLGHELMLVEAKHFQKDDDQLHEAVDVPEV